MLLLILFQPQRTPWAIIIRMGQVTIITMMRNQKSPPNRNQGMTIAMKAIAFAK